MSADLWVVATPPLDEESDFHQRVASQLERKKMISVIASIQVKPGTRDAFVAAFNENVPAVLAEDGCVEYFPATDVDSGLDIQAKDENCVVVIEKWESLDHLHAHLKAPHMVAFREKAGDMIAGISLKVVEKA